MACTFASPCLGHELRVRVMTPTILFVGYSNSARGRKYGKETWEMRIIRE
jgi:hypothetical protein